MACAVGGPVFEEPDSQPKTHVSMMALCVRFRPRIRRFRVGDFFPPENKPTAVCRLDGCEDHVGLVFCRGSCVTILFVCAWVLLFFIPIDRVVVCVPHVFSFYQGPENRHSRCTIPYHVLFCACWPTIGPPSTGFGFALALPGPVPVKRRRVYAGIGYRLNYLMSGSQTRLLNAYHVTGQNLVPV